MTVYTYDDLYVINYTDVIKGTITIPKASVITDILDVTLLGKSLLNYGEIFDENVLHILENFACEQLVPPIDNVIEPDLSQVNPEKPSANPLLSNPTTGELWFNKTDSHLYIYNTLNVWTPVKLRGDIAANNGVIAHGQYIPLPTGITSYSQCSFMVSPQYIDENSNYVACYAAAYVGQGYLDDASTIPMQIGQVYMRYRPSNSVNMVDGLANYIILGNVVPEIHYHPIVSITPTLTAAPVLTSTPTNTVTPSPTISPPVSGSAVPTPTPTSTQTPVATGSVTPTRTGTPVITPSHTAVPTPTPTTSLIAYQTFTMVAGVLNIISGSPDNTDGVTYIGYTVGGPTGTITPSNYKGNLITGLVYISDTSTTPSFVFQQQPSGIPQNIFSKIVFIDQFLITRTYTSASANYVTGTGAIATIWSWAAPTSALFAPGATYTILIYP